MSEFEQSELNAEERIPRVRLVRDVTAPLTDNRCYRVETSDLLTASEAMDLMKVLGWPYGTA